MVNQFDKQMDLRERQLSQQDDQFNKSLSLIVLILFSIIVAF